MTTKLNPALSGVRAKIDRASKHADDIKSVINRAIDPSKYTTRTGDIKFDTNRKQIIVYSGDSQPLDPALPLMIGDCFHNLRSALDHLVFQMAVLHGTSRESAEKTCFPIYLCPIKFKSKVNGAIKPFVSGDMLTAIEESQPYKAYDVPEESDIWILSQLDNIDKHRLLVVASHHAMPVEFLLTLPHGQTFHKVLPEPKWRPSEKSTDLIRFSFSEPIMRPEKVHVQVKTLLTVQLTNTGLYCDGIRVEDAVGQCLMLVRGVVDHFGKRFFGE